MQPLRIVLLTQSPLNAFVGAFIRRLAEDKEFIIAAVLLEQYRWPVRPLRERVKKHGLSYLAERARAKASSKIKGFLWGQWRRDHPSQTAPYCVEALEALGIRFCRTPDVHSPETIQIIQSLDAQLGVIYGSRILKEHLLKIPPLGVLNIHKRKTPEYRGGGGVGYWEVLNSEREIGVTIHYATAKVDEGPILAEAAIPIEPFDTLSSLEIKAGIVGGELYFKTLKEFAQGRREGRPQSTAPGKTYRGAGSRAENLLEAQLKQKQARAYQEKWGMTGDPYLSPYRWLKYALMYPLLQNKLRGLKRMGQCPIIGLYYHRVANDAISPLTLPLEKFAAQIDLIRRYYPIISLEEAHRRLSSGRNDQVAFVITFDDGYEDNIPTAIAYLRHFNIPATLFVSVGHVAEGKPFEHDLKMGLKALRPMTPDQLREANQGCISIGSHGLYHEDFGQVKGEALTAGIVESKRLLGEILGAPPRSFAFPTGIRGVNITKESYELAARHYDIVASAYGGYSFPRDGGRHFKRWCHPIEALSLLQIMDGYRGFTSVLLKRNLWDYRFSSLPPY